ncbi:hypothetical protein Z043_111687 [Scleropages formosus]|uniref:Uncharacterized protein n=1 Tax=Scleropages formosus TaxID=113540 RepID=A0A0P7WZA6_SCLFO|nr:hypothetical protein Z043_111687 [Scleropages formosus]
MGFISASQDDVPSGRCTPWEGSRKLLVEDMVKSGLSDLLASTIKLLQQKVEFFDLSKCSHVSTLLVSLHWLPVDAHIKFKPLVTAYKTIGGSAPEHL